MPCFSCNLPQRLQEAETRNQELSQSVTSATRPLLRQIENLQASLGGQTASWEKLEKNISDRLGKLHVSNNHQNTELYNKREKIITYFWFSFNSLYFSSVDAQAQLAVAVEKERSATEELLSIKAQLASLESQNSLVRQEKARLQAQLEAERNKREKVEDESSR